jgi:pyridoxamine 5'-phosphate oxidase-like protein
MTEGRLLQSMTRGESLRLIGEVPMGRVVFTSRALPAIRPVNHLVEDEQIIIRTKHDTALARAVAPGAAVVAYQADAIDPGEKLGWSVIVVGRASRLPDGEAAARYRKLLDAWVPGPFDEIIVIQAEMIDGFRLVSDGTDGTD